MSAALLAAAKDFIRAAFTRQQLFEVRAYAGEFSSTEVDYTGFTCPVVMLAVLGWKAAPELGRHAREVRMGAFIVTKGGRDRGDRMLEAMNLADALCIALRQWRPAADDAWTLRALDAPPSAENLYGRAVDAKGLALWLVDWTQGVIPTPTLPAGQLYDLLQVDIQDTTQQGLVSAPAPGPSGLVVTEDVQFKTPL